jgi:acyl dehydratase
LGRYFEELEEGATLESAPRRVTRDDIDAFIRLTGDDNRLHTDDDFAREQGFRGRIAHGALVVGIATGLAWSTGILTDTTVAFRAIEDWKFSAPVYPGDRILLRVKIGERRPLPRARAGLIRFDLDVVNQEGATVSSGALRLLMRMKD